MNRKAILSWNFLLCLCVISSAAGANTVLKGKAVFYSFFFVLERLEILTARTKYTKLVQI